MKKILKVAAVSLMMLGMASCKKAEVNTDGAEITLLNFKPELADKWGKIIEGVKNDLNITLKVETAASGTYEDTLRAKISTADAPAIFQINGPVGYGNWSDYIADLDGSDVYNALANKSLAVKIDGKVKAIPVTVEGYGIIYNKTIAAQYFELTNRANTGANKMADIKSYATLKAVVEDMQAHKADLGIDGVFCPSGMDGSDSWRLTGHAFDLPLVGEFGTSTTATPDVLKFTCADNYRNIIDLYAKNTTMDGKAQVGTDHATSSALFAQKKTLMIQNGNWATSELTAGGKVKGEDLAYLPIYCGINNDNIKEASQGLCIGTEAYWSVNKKLDEKKQAAAKKVMNWLFNGNGKTAVHDDLGFMAPFTGFSDAALQPTDPLCKEVVAWMNKDGVNNVAWEFPLVPGTNDQRADLVASLTKYFNNNFDDASWTELVNNAKSKWAALAAAAKAA
jgi:raffinose/stachyose/melibiose transport system substrate-binding protein